MANFSLAALGGTWYQAAMSARFATTVERGAPCATATYTPATADGDVAAATVRSCLLLSRASLAAAADGGAPHQPPSPATDGRPVVACTRGVLATPDVGRAPGRLELSFPPHPPGRFWVLAADGGGGGGRYTTAVVWSCAEGGGPGRAAAQDWMGLSRRRAVARAAVDAATAAAEAGGVALGADNGMLMTDQGADCVYWDDEGAAVVDG